MYFSSTMNYNQLAPSFCSQPSVSGVILHHGETTGVIRGSSQSLFGVDQCEVSPTTDSPGKRQCPITKLNVSKSAQVQWTLALHEASRSNAPQREEVVPPGGVSCSLHPCSSCLAAPPSVPSLPSSSARLPEHTSPPWFPLSHPAAPDTPSLG